MMITNELIRQSIKNGGYTFNKYRNKVLSGYMVSKKDTETIININNLNQLRSRVQDFVDTHKLSRNQYYGLWYNDNKLYIDISVRISTKKQALNIAKQEKQLAIFDNHNLKEIGVMWSE